MEKSAKVYIHKASRGDLEHIKDAPLELFGSAIQRTQLGV